jgi:hypothetical protein
MCIFLMFCENTDSILMKDLRREHVQILTHVEETEYCDRGFCSYHGTCIVNQTCICDHGYITFDPINELQCNYEQKQSYIGVCLQLFFGPMFGAGYIYLGRVYIGVAQLMFFWIGFPIIGKHYTINNLCCVLCPVYWALPVLMWWFLSIESMATCRITDGNGAPIRPYLWL